ncbi:MAG TPA: hypothetical protein VFA58_08840 [Chthoniobacterales bacterium]|nr:hypothetical protein [Chthoniobacterales bacterium]
MDPGVRELVAAISCAALIFCSSCEKHHLGEAPEGQKENVGEAKAGDETPGTREENSSSPAAKTSATPVEFFPATTPTP